MRRFGLLLALALLLGSATVAAATSLRTPTSPQPKLGRWGFNFQNPNDGTFDIIKKTKKIKKGKKTITKVTEYVKNLTYVDDGSLDGGCAGKVRVPGPIRITPWHSSYGEYWYIGSLKHMESNFPTQVHFKATLNGATPLSDLTLAMLWFDSKGSSKTSGQLQINANTLGENTCFGAPYFEHK